MQLNLKKELRQQRIEKALRNNLKKRKIFQNKINKKAKKIPEIRLYYNSLNKWGVEVFKSTMGGKFTAQN